MIWDYVGAHGIRGSYLACHFSVMPPGVNTQYGYGRGRVYLTKAAKQWVEDASLIIGSEAGRIGWEDQWDAYGLAIYFEGSKMDVDAPIKLVQDTITRKLGFDDQKISEVSSTRGDQTVEPLLKVVLYSIGDKKCDV